MTYCETTMVERSSNRGLLGYGGYGNVIGDVVWKVYSAVPDRYITSPKHSTIA